MIKYVSAALLAGTLAYYDSRQKEGLRWAT
jgi:hypothetical protein